MNFIPPIELESIETIKKFQEGKLRLLLNYLAQNSPFYKRHFANNGIDHRTIHSLEDLKTIPPTTKDDLQKYNWEFLCVPRNQIVEYTSTSGTLGKPVTIGLTENDLQRLAYNESISFACADGSSKDLYQLMLTLDRQFMAGIAYYQGIRKLGAGIVRVGPGVPPMQLEAIMGLHPTTLVAVPSFILKLIEYANQHNIDLNKSSVKKAICIGESIRTSAFSLNTIGRKITEHWNINLYSTYASTEMQTAFTECNHGQGGHLHPELLIVELLGDNGNKVAEGQPGEVTVTTLGVEGMPLLRYKTGDISIAQTGKCLCGRCTTRLGPIMGRKQQMVKLKGTTIYPQGIFEILNTVDAIQDYVVEAVTSTLGTDELKIHVVSVNGNQEEVHKKLSALFRSQLRVIPEIIFTTPPLLEDLQAGKLDRKIRRFVDKRNLIIN